MNRSSLIKKIILPLLFLATILFALAQRQADPYVFNSPNDATDELFALYNRGKDMAEKDSLLKSASFLAVGDIMLSRNVAGTARAAQDPLLPFKGVENLLKTTDFNFGNLESPFSGKDTFNPSGSLVFNAPRDLVQGLVDYNFKILNLANNHALDQGSQGIDYTRQYLQTNGIKSVGVGKNLDEAWTPEIVEANGIRIGFVGASYASINDNGKTTNEYVARIEDVKKLQSAIASLKERADFIVVTMHAGTEYTTTPNSAQTDFARAAVDAGADIVIGAHPHWVQTVEQYKGKYIFYSLGNFIFDQEWSQETKEGLVLKINLVQPISTPLQGPAVKASVKNIELVPVIIENYSTPRLATPQESQRILERIGQTKTILN